MFRRLFPDICAFTIGFVLVVGGAALLTQVTAHASEAPCSIEWSSGGFLAGPGPQVVTPEDCSNPFGLANENIEDFTLAIGTTTISSSQSITLPSTATSTEITLDVTEASGSFIGYRFYIFAESGGVYTEIAKDTIMSSGSLHTTLQIPLSESTEQTFHAVVVFEDPPVQMQKPATTWFAYIREKLIPTAHAIYRDSSYQSSHVPFTIQLEETQPEEEEAADASAGASSVLFLPGIQASRLFAAEDISTGLFSGYSAGDRVWEPGRNRDVQMLEMSSAGTPLYSLYSDQILDTITFEGRLFQANISDVYTSISSFFDQLVEEETIVEWYPYAYDWRYSVSDIAERGSIINQSGTRQSLIDTARALAAASHTGQVTIVAHSNGGLLAKALIEELEAAGDAEAVDTLVMIGVPQTGSPKAMASILHGYDQRRFGGLVVRARLARELLNNFPAVYSLLPSARFIEDTDQSVVTFDTSPATQTYREAYGTSIDGYTELRDFLLGTDTAGGRDMSNSLYVPARANSALLDSAWPEKELLSNWIAPSHLRIVEMVGVGLPTPISLRYEDTLGDVCDPVPTATICLTANIPRPFFRYTLLGDETVPGVSAGAYSGNKELYYIDLSDKKYQHADMTEVPGMSEILENVFKKREMTTLPDYFSVDLFDFTNTFTVKQVASPVNILVTDGQGNQTGVAETAEGPVIKMEIPGSWYDELGGVKKVMIPSEIEHTTVLSGTATGTFTYFSDTVLTHDTERDLALYQASTTPQMVATYRSDQSGLTSLQFDFSGDGDIEAVYDWDQEVMESLEMAEEETQEISSPSVRRQGSATLQSGGEVAGIAVADLTPEQRSQLHSALVQLQLIINQLSDDYGNK